MAFGTNLQTQREAQGMSQSTLADKTGVRPTMINQIEAGTKLPSLALAIEIAKVLNCSLDYLCDTDVLLKRI